MKTNEKTPQFLIIYFDESPLIPDLPSEEGFYLACVPYFIRPRSFGYKIFGVTQISRATSQSFSLNEYSKMKTFYKIVFHQPTVMTALAVMPYVQSSNP
ncbi:hypothetical protein TNCT_605861 [Trichonephila clavata]|uniref:Uncharacterized protein n=1 Tax=Trichonephila clavata TaxID=2740835 RepID=A0A8X6KAL5_TRICU|nr:hypothetical protein TNCT_605861 [Trichonephila clavata]